jgi:hypothetical protein
MTGINVERETPDKLSRQVWYFWYDDRTHVLRCSSYIKSERPSSRHKFKSVAQWTQHRRDDFYGFGLNPPLPPDVQHEAVEKFRAELVVEPWT